MTKLFQRAIERTQNLPPEMRDEIARIMLAIAGDERHRYTSTPDEQADQDAADFEEARGEYATEQEVLAVWAKHRL